MFNRSTPEVLVVGAGPVGLFAALALAKREIPIQVVDKGWRPGTHSYALALHPRAMELLRELGLADRVMERAYPVSRIGLYDSAARRAQICVGSGADATSCLAVLRQDAFEYLLEQKLDELGVQVSWSHEAFRMLPEGGHVSATIDKFEKDSMGYAVAHTEWVLAKSMKLDVPFVIGADGHNSRVRRSLKFDFPEVGSAQYYAVFEFKSNADLDHEMCIVLGDETTDVLWPLPGGLCRWSFQLMDASAVEENRHKDRLLMQPGLTETRVFAEANLKTFIAERAPWFTGSIDEVTWRIMVRFERRLSTGFGRDRMWMAGDAAHLTGPAGIQSMNVGLSEAHDLAGIIGRILRDGASLDQLDAFDGRWMAVWRQLLSLEDGLHTTPETDPWVGVHADRLMACLPGYGPDLAALASQLKLQV